MNNKKPPTILTAFFTLTLLLTTTVQAGQITGYTPFPGINSVAGVAIAPLAAINNDDAVGTSPNDIWVTQKDYIAVAPVDIVFHVDPSLGVTEYSFREGVQNSTGLDWTGYTLQLGFGTGPDFVPSSDSDGLDFDDPDYTSSPDFTTFFSSAVPVTEDIIVASGGVHPNGGFSLPYYTFSIDVPDFPPGVDSFTLRQQPIIDVVPEPSSVLLTTLAAAACCSFRRRNS